MNGMTTGPRGRARTKAPGTVARIKEKVGRKEREMMAAARERGARKVDGMMGIMIGKVARPKARAKTRMPGMTMGTESAVAKTKGKVVQGKGGMLMVMDGMMATEASGYAGGAMTAEKNGSFNMRSRKRQKNGVIGMIGINRISGAGEMMTTW